MNKINTSHFCSCCGQKNQNSEPCLSFCRCPFLPPIIAAPLFCHTKLALHTHMEIEAFAVLSRISESPLLAPTHKVHRVFSANLICCCCSEIAYRRDTIVIYKGLLRVNTTSRLKILYFLFMQLRFLFVQKV